MIDPQNPDFSNTPASPDRAALTSLPRQPEAAPYVTVVTSFYNTGQIFHETARTVLKQSLQQWEWLIIDDGTTDTESLRILNVYAHKDPRVRVIRHFENRGLSAARNTGFQESRAQYTALLGSDDLLEPTALEKWLWFLESYPVYAFVHGYTVRFGAQKCLWQEGFISGEKNLEANQVSGGCLVRNAIHKAVGGFDESIRGGLEDWEFWIRCAHAGYWGYTIPEYLDWCRHRPTQTHANIGGRPQAKELAEFQADLRKNHASLWERGVPKVQTRKSEPYELVPDDLRYENRLHKSQPRLLLIIPWLAMGGADKFNLDLADQLIQRGWELTVATTVEGDDPWLPEFEKRTPDVFMLHRILHLRDYPRFLRYLIHSRRPDVVMVSNSEFGYRLLPYLRSHFPDVAFTDFNHAVSFWVSGGYPNLAALHQSWMDLNIVSSQQVKDWMIGHGADPERIEVCYTNIDVREWRPDRDKRKQVRREFGIDDDCPSVLYAARIGAEKQPLVFAEVMAELARNGLRFRAFVAGDGPELESLTERVHERELGEEVQILGTVENSRILELMQAVDVFFLPSEFEGISLAFFEAMACGVAVVGADVGGQAELVTPECGVLMPRADAQTEIHRYAEVLAELFSHPERLRAMGAAGRQRVCDHFRLEDMGRRIESLLSGAQRLRASRPRQAVPYPLARACAVYTVEHTRLSAENRRFTRLADHFWRESTKAHMTTQEVERQKGEALKERDRWYREVLALGNELRTLRSNMAVRLCRKLGLVKPPEHSAECLNDSPVNTQ